jgi:SecD/SecF fusion protein
MDRPKRWHLFLIVGVLLLTMYNILPTVFFYTKPLKAPINPKKAESVALQMADRVNSLEGQSKEWVDSFSKLISVKPISVQFDSANPQLIQVKFSDLEQAKKFRKFLPRAGSLIGFQPAQLSLQDLDPTSKTVTLQRRIPIHFAKKDLSSYFQYSTVKDSKGNPTDFYRELINDRVVFLGLALGGSSESSSLIQTALNNPQDLAAQDLLVQVSQNMLNVSKVFEKTPTLRQRYFASFSQNENAGGRGFIEAWVNGLDRLKDQTRLARIDLENSSSQDPSSAIIHQQQKEFFLQREALLSEATSVIRKYITEFSAGQKPLNFTTMDATVKATPVAIVQTFSLQGCNPLVESITMDWNKGEVALNLYSDVQSLRQSTSGLDHERLDQAIYNGIAQLSRQSGEKVTPLLDHFVIGMNNLSDAQSFLALKLYNIATAESATLKDTLVTGWAPRHPDLQRNVFPIWDYETYQKLPASEKKLGLVVFSPSTLDKVAPHVPPRGFKMNSIYVIAKGIDKISQRYENGDSEGAKQFQQDFSDLRALLQKSGFVGYSGAAYPIAAEFKSDFIFEQEDYYQDLLKATRENFSVHGTKRYAVLEFSNLEQRILTENKIDDQIHEDLLKWRDDYRAAQVDIKGVTKFDVPAPTQNALISNFKLSFVKYFRGDERKVIRWGLDLSGGKTVQLQLRDTNNKLVTNESDIRQGINELYGRVNKMGISEVSIRQEGNSIALDFPGSQSLSAAELVKASSMYFHIMNEKFMSNPTLAETTHRFLQEVWNEAVVTGKKESDEINAIAWRHLYGESSSADAVQPRSAAAKTLYDQGLRLAHPQDTYGGSGASSLFDTTFSKITLYRGDDFTEWHGQTHPLLIVFRNYGLEGSNLENIRANYDPSKGNYLAFGVQSSSSSKDGSKTSPRDDLQAWTSQFAKEKIVGTPNEAYSRGYGWRMAVILNGSVITAPTLDSALRDSASITGSFTQREVNRLESDLKAGSLSFTPHILSEKNVSPELGGKERIHGIIAMVLSLILAIGTMIAYYRFGGFVAAVAVIINLLIMWAAYQNLGATLTLAGIAGVILTVAMSVDANVLVFERIREEFAITGRIASAVHAGYRKAFSAIIDSNITTLIAALILLNFDAGPIRGFAVTLIIGIVSSLFTSLFMTRFFFSWWVMNPEHRELKMSNFIKSAHFNFLKFTKPTLIVSAVVIAVGSFLLIAHKQNILGMDFTGGYALTVELPVTAQKNYRAQVEEALLKQGISSQELQIRELGPSNQVRVFLSRSLEQKGRPFYELPETTNVGGYPYEGNPKIVWIVDALQKSNIDLSVPVLQDLGEHWTAISGQMSETMRTNALVGITIALLCILAYITLRFEYKYAISATLCLIHDVVFCLGVLAILNILGVPIQIDLHTVAALMTIVGYSLNDTIIVFDRIREDVKHMRKRTLTEIINHALNVTLSRTLMTSGITLLVLIPLIILGGSTLFGFALIMAIGVIFGTLSSLFIAAPLMQFFHNRQQQKQGIITANEP